MLSCCVAVSLWCFLALLLCFCFTMPSCCCPAVLLLCCLEIPPTTAAPATTAPTLTPAPASTPTATPTTAAPTTPAPAKPKQQPTPSIHPTTHKQHQHHQQHQATQPPTNTKKTEKSQESKDKRTSKNNDKTYQIRQKVVQGGSRMHAKWSQNREKIIQLPKLAPGGAHEWLPSMKVAPLDTFLDPPWDPKNHQKSIFREKGCSKERFSINFCSKSVFSCFCDRFLVDFSWKIDGKLDVFFTTALVFFQTGDPHETPYFTGPEPLLHFFQF